MKLSQTAQDLLARIPPGVATRLEGVLEKVPGVGQKVRAEKKKIALELKHGVEKQRPKELTMSALPQKPVDGATVLSTLKALTERESPKWREGKVSGGVYHGDPAHLRLLDEVYALFSQTNPLHADVWPSVARFESEIVAMTAQLLGGDPRSTDDANVVCGTLSSGGTESIMLAVKSYREHARSRGRRGRLSLVVPASAHPAFDKAGHTLEVDVIRVPVGSDGRANVKAMKAALRRSTIAMVGSAPSFPHGVIDPIEELSELARARRIGFHTDACLGGFVLPFARELGYPVPRFDFSLPGVTSMSADTHKFGYAAKGSSVVLYRGRALRRSQYFITPDWSGGLYATPGFAGSRPGALVASAWAALVTTGKKGYLDATRAVLETAAKVRDAIRAIPELEVVGDPLWVIAFRSRKVDVYRVLDEMTARGWSLNGLQKPAAVHLCVTLRHTQPGVAERFAEDLRASVEAAKGAPVEGGMAPVYGLASSLPFKGLVGDLLAAYLDALHDP